MNIPLALLGTYPLRRQKITSFLPGAPDARGCWAPGRVRMIVPVFGGLRLAYYDAGRSPRPPAAARVASLRSVACSQPVWNSLRLVPPPSPTHQPGPPISSAPPSSSYRAACSVLRSGLVCWGPGGRCRRRKGSVLRGLFLMRVKPREPGRFAGRCAPIGWRQLNIMRNYAPSVLLVRRGTGCPCPRRPRARIIGTMLTCLLTLLDPP